MQGICTHHKYKENWSYGSGCRNPPSVYIVSSNLSVVDNFKYLGSSISRNLSLDVEINACIGRAGTVMAKLNKRVWQSINLTMTTRLKVYQACITSILLYGSETLTPYARQEAKLYSFHLRCLRRILGITWQDRIPTPLCWRRPNAPAYMHYSAKDAFDGWDTYAGWEKEEFQRTSSTASLKRVHVKLAAQSFASKIFARRIWSLQPLT